MGSGASRKRQADDLAAATTTSRIKYRNGRPKVHGDEIIGCFSTSDDTGKVVAPPGLLYRIVMREKRQWYFYNDTKTYNMVITGYFGALNIIKALGKAKMWREMPSGLLIVELVVPPLQTEPYLEGIVTDGFDLRFRATLV
ncbi:calpain-like cysteine peptidase [Trypanosoma grayi]|uniref:calpain-like cysteine peptidase n=1 Tax=Trypanosoma grayi TaxID=71804 RepID=UPI0004F44583|nr:calpain-like cysteine peptidase [Trypanosoma grayi]KEG08698.1 calpain-like cysteine peptidase [Trypanosoma grayi]